MRYLKSLATGSSLPVAFGALCFAAAPALALQEEAAATEEAQAETAATDEAEAEPTGTIVDVAVASTDHTTLVAAVQQAELADTLAGPGPYTVFAPTDEAFGLLGQATIAALMQDTAKAQLAQILSYHVIPGAIDAETLAERIEAAGGELTLPTAEGSTITASIVNGAVALSDEIGGVSYVVESDVEATNGVVHVINGVLVPEPETPEPAESAGDR